MCEYIGCNKSSPVKQVSMGSYCGCPWRHDKNGDFSMKSLNSVKLKAPWAQHHSVCSRVVTRTDPDSCGVHRGTSEKLRKVLFLSLQFIIFYFPSLFSLYLRYFISCLSYIPSFLFISLFLASSALLPSFPHKFLHSFSLILLHILSYIPSFLFISLFPASSALLPSFSHIFLHSFSLILLHILLLFLYPSLYFNRV
jgi:hypothetical protein